MNAESPPVAPGETGAAYLGAAAWVGHEYQDARYVWPRAFSELTDEYDRRYGIDEAHLRRISQINFANARHHLRAVCFTFHLYCSHFLYSSLYGV